MRTCRGDEFILEIFGTNLTTIATRQVQCLNALFQAARFDTHAEKQFDNICMLLKGMHILLAKWDDRTPGSFQQASTSVPIKSTDLSENTAGVASQKWIFTQILS